MEEVPEEEVEEPAPAPPPEAPLSDFPSAIMAGAAEAAGTSPAQAALYEEIFDWDRPFDWEAEETGNHASESSPLTPSGPAMEAASEADEEDASLPEVDVGLLVQESPLKTKEYLNSGGDLFFIYNAATEPQRVNLRLRPSRPGTPHLLDAWTGEIQKLPVWMPFTPEEGGGLSLTLDLASLEAKLVWLRPSANPDAPLLDNIERATFTVESFDGRVASGYAT